jgi:peroxiredoxin
MGGTVRTPDLSSVVVWVVALVALLFSTALLWQNLRLRADLERFSGGLSGPAEAVPGDRVPPFQAITLKGRENTVSYVGRRGYVLLFFSPKCRVCDEQFSLWERLSGKIRRECWEILAVSRDPREETQSWAQGRDLGFDIVALPERALWRAYRITAIPQTVVVSPSGIICWVHSGYLREDEEAYHELLSLVEQCHERCP